MDKKLLAILCCPVTHKGLSMAQTELLKAVNAAISADKLVNSDGDKVAGQLSEALVTDDGKTLYPIDDGIPVLLEGEAVALSQLEQGT